MSLQKGGDLDFEDVLKLEVEATEDLAREACANAKECRTFWEVLARMYKKWPDATQWGKALRERMEKLRKERKP